MDTATILESDEAWRNAVVQQRRRVAFDADRRTKAARRAYKQALVRGVPERDAWAAMRDALAKVHSSLDQRERNGEFEP